MKKRQLTLTTKEEIEGFKIMVYDYGVEVYQLKEQKGTSKGYDLIFATNQQHNGVPLIEGLQAKQNTFTIEQVELVIFMARCFSNWHEKKYTYTDEQIISEITQPKVLLTLEDDKPIKAQFI